MMFVSDQPAKNKITLWQNFACIFNAVLMALCVGCQINPTHQSQSPRTPMLNATSQTQIGPQKNLKLDETLSIDNKPLILQRGEFIVKEARTQLGVHYKSGGDSPQNGFDCSGFVRHVFQKALNIQLPRTSKEMSQIGQSISRHAILPGDLVFYKTKRGNFSHVGIYIGDNQFLHAPGTGKYIQTERLDTPHWAKNWNGARRM